MTRTFLGFGKLLDINVHPGMCGLVGEIIAYMRNKPQMEVEKTYKQKYRWATRGNQSARYIL
jgi:hypothetical protein